MKVIKKDGTLEEFDGEKIVNAVNKSASRVMITLDDTAFHEIVGAVLEVIEEKGLTDIPVAVMHNIVEQVLDKYDPRIATSYRNYRNYKQDFVHVLDRVFQKSQVVRFQGDKENANTDSALVATKRCLIFNELNKRLYRKFFMTQEELQACRDGYIYIHDQSARLDTMNCCLFRVNEVMKGGFEMGNIWYNEPKTLDVFFDVLGDIILATASQQYGGFTVPEVDKLAAPYAEKSYKKYVDEYMEIRNQQTFTQEVHEWAMQKVERDFEQGFQGIEMKLNGHYDHIGYVFADQNIVGIDIDAGFEDGLMTPLCADIMQACHSYTEKSRSGRGVHILMRGKLPFSGKNNLAGVEIYQARRFFIMTGKVLIFPEIIDNQEAIDYVVEKYFKETEKTGSNSNIVQRIYSPKFPKPMGGRIFVRPDYPEIPDGGRNISLTSLAGALHNTGYTPMQIYQELQRVNKEVCKPPLPDRELQIIAESISRYRR